MDAALRTLGLDIDRERLRQAIANSTYEAMRAHEDKVAALDRDKGHARIMRRGEVGEWKEWVTPQLERYFAVPERPGRRAAPKAATPPYGARRSP
jgi:hypothetical protein